jgi:chemotaxis protein methyltransferase CheR
MLLKMIGGAIQIRRATELLIIQDSTPVMSLQENVLTEKDFKKIQNLIFEYAGISLGDTKQIMVQSRLAKRMRKLELEDYANYIKLVQSPTESDERERFVNALTTNKTDFFRESHHFDFLAAEVFPELVKRANDSGSKKIRIWCSASSTGEEPYTIAMAVREFFPHADDWDIRILASDIDTEVLKTAEEGVYAESRFDDLPAGFQRKYFQQVSKSDQTYRINPSLRELITFRQINLHDDQWPIHTTFDVIFCRNVLIYFDADSQQKIIQRFGDYLRRSGYLMIGHSESIHCMANDFRAIGNTVYQKMTEPASVRKAFPDSPTDRHVTPKRTPKSRPASLPGKPARRRPAGPQSLLMDPNRGEPKQPIIVGDVFASDQPMWITTLLGSCVSVCLYDQIAGVAGMNHFMLPTPMMSSEACNRYGVHSMELLINAIMSKGASRRRLKAKVFGGSRATSNRLSQVGKANAEFAFKFLNDENIPVVAEFTCQAAGMYIEFHTRTQKVHVRLLESVDPEVVSVEERSLDGMNESSDKHFDSATLFVNE